MDGSAAYNIFLPSNYEVSAGMNFKWSLLLLLVNEMTLKNSPFLIIRFQIVQIFM